MAACRPRSYGGRRSAGRWNPCRPVHLDVTVGLPAQAAISGRGTRASWAFDSRPTMAPGWRTSHASARCGRFIHSEMVAASVRGSTTRMSYRSARTGIGGAGTARISSEIVVSWRGRTGGTSVIVSAEPTRANGAVYLPIGARGLPKPPQHHPVTRIASAVGDDLLRENPVSSNTAAEIVKSVGGAANIESLTYCATRLRFQLRRLRGPTVHGRGHPGRDGRGAPRPATGTRW